MMDANEVEKILEKYAKRIPDEPVLSEQDIAQLRARFGQNDRDEQRPPSAATVEAATPSSGRRLLWPLVGVAGLAAAAAVVFVFVLPFAQVPKTAPFLFLNVEVDASWPRTVRGSEVPHTDDPGEFRLRVRTSKTAFVHLAVVTESGDLWVRQVTEDGKHSVRVAGEFPLTYDLWYNPDGKGLRRSMYVIVVAAKAPIAEKLAAALPPRIVVESAEDMLKELEELGRALERQLDCVVAVRAIEPF
ncbi:MAG: hypothetical protein ACYSVY_12215 [Planctomycetota bacterium]|jgi:hypothetical protein